MTERWLPTTDRDFAVRDLLRAVRTLGDALDRMHSGMKGDMDMNATDIAALRMLIVREQRGEAVSPHDLADHLRISTASTTKLLDRLSASGHLERRPHPTDRRARVVVLTQASRDEFYQHMGERLRAMRVVAGEFDDEQLSVIRRFLLQLSDALDPVE